MPQILPTGNNVLPAYTSTFQNIEFYSGTGKQACSNAPSAVSDCGGTSENIGFSADFPQDGEYEVCIRPNIVCNFGAGGQCIATYRVVRTSNTDDTVLERGNDYASFGLNVSTGGDANFATAKTCSRFNITKGENTFKLEIDFTGSTLSAGLNFGINSHKHYFSAKIVRNSAQTPILVGGSAFQGHQNPRLKVWRLVFGGTVNAEESCTSSPCTIFLEKGPTNDWINGNVLRGASAGDYYFTTNPVFKPNEYVSCTCTISGATGAQGNCGLVSPTTTNRSIFKADGTGVLNFGRRLW